MLGRTVSHYEVTRALGAGAMGTVFAAHDTLLGRDVALKILQDGGVATEESRLRFLQEARAASALNHPNIVTIYDVVRDGETDYIVMELVSGQTLEDRMLCGLIPLDETLDILDRIADALGAAHKRGIVHRDLKPANVMLTPSGGLKVLDFGLAKQLIPADAPPDLPPMLRTQSGIVVGTPSFMSPEQALGQPLDGRSDLFSLGSIGVEMLTGRNPFEVDSAMATMYRIAHGKPISLDAVPPVARAMFERLLARDRADRYQSAGELRSAIADIRPARTVRLAADHRKTAAERAQRHSGALVERRHVTIVRCQLIPTEPDGGAVDAEDLPEILHQIAGEYQRVCAEIFGRFEGEVLRASGGAVTVSFGYPLVHEDDARRAVRAALAVQEAVAGLSPRIERELGVRLSVRAGVHTAMTVVDTGAGAGDAIADSETAAFAGRILNFGPPSGVIVGDATQRRIDGFFETSELGVFPVGPERQSARVLRIERDRGFESRLEAKSAGNRMTELVGRDSELDLLLRRWAEAKRGDGQVVLLRAEAGIGKSRLVAELRKRTGGETRTWIEGRCSPLYCNSALFPAVRSLAVWLGLDVDGGAARKLEVVERALARAGAPLESALPPIATLLSIPWEQKYAPPQANPREQKQLVIETIVRLFAGEASYKPVLFVVEDLHWVDPSTVELLDLLIEQVPSLPILILFTFRPEYEPPAEWLRRANASIVALDRLDEAAVRGMTRNLAGGKELPPEVFEQIFARTEGFPLFVEDLTRMVLESEMLTETGGRYVLTGAFQPLAIPDTLQETLMARVSRLATAKPVAQVGAAIGREFEEDMLRAVGGFDDRTLTKALGDLVSAGLLHRRGLLTRPRYVFKHVLVQEALYQSLLKKQRREYHVRIAEVLVTQFASLVQAHPELVAWHHEKGGEVAKAVEYLRRAAELALSRSANREALSHVRHALNVLSSLPEGEERWSAELALRIIEATVLLALEGWAASLKSGCYDRARELCRTLHDPRLFAVLRGLWSVHLSNADLSEALAVAQELREMATAANDEDMLLEAHYTLNSSLSFVGRLEEALEHQRAVMAIYDPERHHLSHAIAYGHDPAFAVYGQSVAALSLLGRIRESRRREAEALALLDRSSHPYSHAHLIYRLCRNAIQIRDVEAAARYGQRLVDLATEHHFTAWLSFARFCVGWAMAAGGDTEAGIPRAIEGVLQWFATGAKLGARYFPAFIADLAVRAGRLEEAEQWVEEGLAGLEGSEDRHYLSELYRVRGEILAAHGRDEEALTWFRTAVETACQGQEKLHALRAATGMARLYVRAGDPAAAAAAMQPFAWMLEEDEVPDVLEAKAVMAHGTA